MMEQIAGAKRLARQAGKLASQAKRVQTEEEKTSER